MDSKSEKIALFRYGLIATLVLERLPRGELTRRARELAAHEYDIPFSNRRHISVDTLMDWPCAIATAVWRRWHRIFGAIAENRE